MSMNQVQLFVGRDLAPAIQPMAHVSYAFKPKTEKETYKGDDGKDHVRTVKVKDADGNVILDKGADGQPIKVWETISRLPVNAADGVACVKSVSGLTGQALMAFTQDIDVAMLAAAQAEFNALCTSGLFGFKKRARNVINGTYRIEIRPLNPDVRQQATIASTPTAALVEELRKRGLEPTGNGGVRPIAPADPSQPELPSTKPAKKTGNSKK